jgi:hypothetical protein
MTPCNLLTISRSFVSLPYPEDGNSSFLRNLCQFLHSIAFQTTTVIFINTAELSRRLGSGTLGFGKKAGDFLTASWSNCEILVLEGGAFDHSSLLEYCVESSLKESPTFRKTGLLLRRIEQSQNDIPRPTTRYYFFLNTS